MNPSIVIDEAPSSGSASPKPEHPLSSEAEHPLSSVAQLFFDSLFHDAARLLADTAPNEYAPNAPPILGHDATYTNDLSPAFRRMTIATSGLPPIPAHVSQVEVPIDVPAPTEPVTAASAAVSGLSLLPSQLRSNGVNDLMGLVAPILSVLNGQERHSWGWDFSELLRRTVSNLHTIEGSGDPTGLSGFSVGVVTAPALVAYQWCWISPAQFGEYISNTLPTANCSAFSYDSPDTLIVWLPRWDADLAVVGYSAWSLNNHMLYRNVAGAGPVYSSAYYPTETPNHMKVVFVVNSGPAAQAYTTGSPAANAATLPLVAPLYEEYMHWLIRIIADRSNTLFAMVKSALSFDALYGVVGSTGVATLTINHSFAVNAPNPLLFGIKYAFQTSATRCFPFPSHYGAWLEPLANRLWSFVEYIALKRRLSPAYLCESDSTSSPRTWLSAYIHQSIDGLHFIFSRLGLPFVVRSSTYVAAHSTELYPVLTPNKWLEDYGVKLVAPAPSIRWRSPTALSGNQHFLPVNCKPDGTNSSSLVDDMLWPAALCIDGTGSATYNLRLTGAGITTVYASVPLTAAGVHGVTAATVSQLRPFFPVVGARASEPTGTPDNTYYFTQTSPNAHTFNSSGAVLPGLALSGKDIALNAIVPESFLGFGSW